jgi:hypothetical protein
MTDPYFLTIDGVPVELVPSDADLECTHPDCADFTSATLRVSVNGQDFGDAVCTNHADELSVAEAINRDDMPTEILSWLVQNGEHRD